MEQDQSQKAAKGNLEHGQARRPKSRPTKALPDHIDDPRSTVQQFELRCF